MSKVVDALGGSADYYRRVALRACEGTVGFYDLVSVNEGAGFGKC